MKATPARRKFKDTFGQSNHFLITSLIGLDAILKYNVRKPDEFSTVWNPKDVKRSVERSREFVLASFLVRSVDAIDFYFNLLNKSPKLPFAEPIQYIFDKHTKSVYNKALLLAPHFQVDPLIIALTDVLITWRNNLTHSSAENRVRESTRAEIQNNIQTIQQRFRGLNAETICDQAESKKQPKFKEVASLIEASHLYVEQFDAEILRLFQQNFFEIQRIELKDQLKKDLKTRRRYFNSTDSQKKFLIENLLYKKIGFCDFQDPTLLTINITDLN